MKKFLFIVWFGYARRAETIAAELDTRVSFVYEARLKGLWLTPLRYLIQGWNTWRLLERERPEVVIVQNPPIFAPLVVAIWCKLRGKNRLSDRRACYVIDAHTSSFHHPHWRWTHPMLRLLARRAAVTFVTDQAALDMLANWKARGFFLIDGLPNLSPSAGTIGSKGERRVAVISTFSDVEPIEGAFNAASLLPLVTFYITGDPRRASSRLLAKKPDNVILTGFLQGGNYTALLKNVHGIVVLTKEPNALSCAAYEALVVGKPVVASEGPEMRRIFTRGFIYVNNSPEAIAAGIRQMLDEREALTKEAIAMREALIASREPTLEKFIALLK